MDRQTAEAVLLEHGIEPRFLSESRFNFLQAFRKGLPKLAEAFIVCEMPLRATEDDEAPLIKAADASHSELVELALRYGAGVNSRDKSGNTASQVAAKAGHLDVVRLLVEPGATLDNKSKTGWTPLLRALKDDKPSCVERWLALGADPNFGSEWNMVPLRLAQPPAAVRKLLANSSTSCWQLALIPTWWI